MLNCHQSIRFLLLMGVVAMSTGCSDDLKKVDLTETPYHHLPGWDKDRHADALPALKHTCKAIEKKSGDGRMIARANGEGRVEDWKPVCRKLAKADLKSHDDVKSFMEANFTAYQVSLGGQASGKFTGYYVPNLRGSRKRHGKYQTPLYRTPAGEARRIPRSAIVNGALKGKGLEILYLDDPVDAFFVQIEGTGKVTMDDGSVVRVNYANQNGFPYYAIANALIERGAMTKHTASAQAIRRWLHEHPLQAESIMSLNQSYVYFKEDPWNGDVIGSHNVPLTPLRSMAVDRSYIPLGTPLWLSTAHPVDQGAAMQQLMVAQDVGGAIKGAIRGDYYWGVGDRAGELAGLMNHEGQMYVFLPK